MFERPVVHAMSTVLVSVSLLAMTGCRKSKPEREYKTIKGTALNIDEATRKVAMSFYHKKKQMEMRIEGTITQQTEILINGRVAQLSEIKIGEQVIVTGYKEGDGNRKRLITTRVEVQRADEWSGGPGSSSKLASKPTSKPAAK